MPVSGRYPPVGWGAREEVGDDFGIGVGLDLNALGDEVVAEHFVVRQVTVVGQGDLFAGLRIPHDDGLCVAGEGTTGGAVTGVPDSDVATQKGQILFIEYL